jgi:hypothetical protein
MINFRQIAVGLGLALFFLFFRYRWPAVNRYVAYVGMLLSILIVAIALIPPRSPLANETFPGFSTTIALKINDAAKIGRQYIFEYKTPEGAKTSFYLAGTGRFSFSTTDIHNEIYSIEIPVGAAGVPIYKFIFLSCEVGVADASTTLRVLIDGKEIAYRTFPFRIDLGSKAWIKGTIGADTDGQNNGAFETLAMNGMGHVTFTDAQLESFIRGFRKYLHDIGSPIAERP